MLFGDTEHNSHSTWLRKDVSMYMHHEVSSSSVFHDKAYMFWCLETCKQIDQKGVAGAVDSLKDPLLTHQTGDRAGDKCGMEVTTIVTGGKTYSLSLWVLFCN